MQFLTQLMRPAVCVLLSSLALLLVACQQESSGESAATTAAQQTFNWRLVMTWPRNYPGLGTAPENFAQAVEAMSGGRLKIKVSGAGEVVPAMGVFDAVARGAVEMGHGAAYYWKGKIPAAQFFTAVPFGLNAQEMNSWLHYGGGIELWREVYEPYNLVPFAGGSTGVQMAGWFRDEIKSVADLKGLKMRIPGLAGEVFQRLGGVPITLPGGELYTAMQTGAIDATEWVGPYNDLTFGLYKVAKHYYYPGWHEPGAILEFIINKEAWDQLPADLQAIVTYAARAINQDMLDEYTSRNNQALAELVDKHGVQLHRLPADVMAQLKQTSAQVIDEIVTKDPLAKRVYDSFKAFQDNVQPYSAVSEQAFMQARD